MSSTDFSTAKVKMRLRFQIVRQWRSAGRWEFSEAELEAEIDLRIGQVSRGQQLPLFDAGQIAAETKRESCRSTRGRRIGIRQRIESILEQAGSEGRTREQLATELHVKEGTVSAAVRYLLDQGQASEPFKRASSCGNAVAVVVLNRFSQRGAA